MKKITLVLVAVLLMAKLMAKDTSDGLIAVFSCESTVGRILIINAGTKNVEIRSVNCSFRGLNGGPGGAQNLWHEVPFVLKANAAICVAVLPSKADEIKLEVDVGNKPMPLPITKVDVSKPWIDFTQEPAEGGKP